MHYEYKHRNVALARELRKNMTKEERRLWYEYLRDSNCRWRRQHPVGNYILDFYCPRLKLAIELDGSEHYSDDKIFTNDSMRSGYLRDLGIYVIRFSNLDIRRNLSGVCDYIDRVTDKLIKEGE